MKREEALQLIREWVKNENLVRHMLATEAAVRTYARRYGADPDRWGLAALLHDADYELHPDRHPAIIVEHLEALGLPPEVTHAIAAHGDHTGVPRRSLLDKVLYACDEVTGLIVATALMHPGRLSDLEASSVVKKMGTKGFARGVNRDRVRSGVEALGLDLEEHIDTIIKAMREIEAELGLQAQKA